MHTTRGARTEHNTDTTHNTPSIPTTRGSSSSGASAVDQAGGGQEPDPSMEVDPTNNVIDVDANEDNDQTQAELIILFQCLRTHVSRRVGGFSYLSYTHMFQR